MPRFSKEELIQLQKKYKTDAAIGKRFDITRQYIHFMRKLYDIPPIPGARTVFPPPRITKNEFIRLQKRLGSDKAIAKKVGLSGTRVGEIRKGYGIPSIAIDNTKRNAKIISMAKNGMTGTAIAMQFKLVIPYVCRIINDGGVSLRRGAPARARVSRSLLKH